ncbi:hypothetical protein CKO41_02410 [Thiococcus pfennigii]|nr:hypothetical protein [Thiococcus pfennigii]MBK1730674.1 hypothetical protein [Thiococcus pfennigii]
MATLCALTQKSPMILSSEPPRGTGLRLLRALTCTPTRREAYRLQAIMSTPLAFRAVGMTFYPRSESR